MTYYAEAAAIGALEILRLDEASGNFVTDSGTYSWSVTTGTPTREVSIMGLTGISVAADCEINCTDTGLRAGLGLDSANWSIAWVASIDSSNQIMWSKSSSSFAAYTNNGNVELFAGSTKAALGVANACNDSTARFFVLTGDSVDGTKLYVNGCQVDTDASVVTPPTGDEFTIASYDSGSAKFDGSLAGLCFFDKTLTRDEVQRLNRELQTDVSGSSVMLVCGGATPTVAAWNLLEEMVSRGNIMFGISANETEVTSGVGVALVPTNGIGVNQAGEYNGQGSSLPCVHLDPLLWDDEDWTTGQITAGSSTDIRYNSAAEFAWPSQSTGTDVTVKTAAGSPYDDVGATYTRTEVCQENGGGDGVVWAIERGTTVLNSTNQAERAVVGPAYDTVTDYNSALYDLIDAALAWAANPIVYVAKGSLTLAGLLATVDGASGVTVTASLGTLTLAGQQATVIPNTTVSAGLGSLTLAGQQATVTPGAVTTTASLGTLALAGQQATVVVASPQTITAALGSLTLAGLSATVDAPYILTASLGALTLAGLQATLLVTLKLQGDLSLDMAATGRLAPQASSSWTTLTSKTKGVDSISA